MATTAGEARSVPILVALNLILLGWSTQGGGDKVNQLIATAVRARISLKSKVLSPPAGGNAILTL